MEEQSWKYINDRLSFKAELLWTDWKLMSYTKYENGLKSNTFTTAQRSCRGKKAYLFFEDIKDRAIKETIRAIVNCDPYDLASKNNIADQLVNDLEAKKFFRDYVYNSDRRLPEDRILEYTANASILNLFNQLDDKRKRERRIKQNNEDFWSALAVEAQRLERKDWPHKLNANWRNLKEKAAEYKDKGYPALIHPNYGNTSAEKLIEPARNWALARWGSQIERVTSIEDLHTQYNKKAKEENWPRLKTEVTLRNYLFREDVEPIWYAARYGELKAAERFGYQHRLQPTGMRDSLWYSDGTKVNYFYLITYIDKHGKTIHKRETTSVYEVMDDFSECLLGHYFSDVEDHIAAFNAYRKALVFAGYKPYQVTFDGGSGNKKLQASGFFNKMSRLNIRTKPYNGKSKTIENAFGRFQSEYLKKDWFFTGMNIPSKKDESKANMEFINANNANLPSLEEIKERYEQRRNEWNAAPHSRTGIPREQMYRESSNPKTPKLEKIDMIDLFWTLREKPLAVNNRGIEFQDRNLNYFYTPYTPDNLPDQEWIYRNISKQYLVKWDVEDTETIALYEESPNGLIYVREMRDPNTVQVLHRGRQEQAENEAQYFTDVRTEGNRLRIEYRDKMESLLEQHNQLPEQHGLNSPKLSGIEGRRKRASVEPRRRDVKPISMAKTQKVESMLTEDDILKELYNEY